MIIEWLTRDDKAEALGVLWAAFRRYPVMHYTLREAGAAYDEHLEALIDFFCEERLCHGAPVLGLREEGGLLGVALVNEPTQRPTPPALRQVYARLTEVVGADAIDRLERYEEVVDQGLPEIPHHYLDMIGVHPAHQGKGYGKHLLDAVKGLAASDPASAGVCLNTETPHNVPYYAQRGFRVVFEGDVEKMHTWCMFAPCE